MSESVIAPKIVANVITTKKAESPKPSLVERPSKEVLKEYVAKVATSYNLTDRLPEIEYIIQNESGWLWYNHNAISFGLLAFTKPTWSLCKGDIWNPYAQIDCGIKLMSQQQWWRWDTWCTKFGQNDVNCKRRGL